MKTENRSFTHKRKTYHGTIVWPDDLAEAIRLLGERDTWSAFRLGYLELCKRQICGITPRRRSQRIDLGALPPEAQDLVRELIDQLHAQSLQPQPIQKSAPLESQPTTPNDFDEMPAEAEVQASSHADPFEEDFARYLASLGSSPQPHTETA
jgi:hypothetical protein